VDLRQKILMATDRVLAAVLTAVVLGGAVCFGGVVWWFLPAFVVLGLLLVLIRLAQFVIRGRMPVFRSPLTALWILALVLGLVQSIPLPAALASRISPAAHQAYASGGLLRLVESDDPQVTLPEPAPVRSPATIDRSATLRWLVVAAGCLAVFWTASQFVDRLGRLYLVWGSVLAGFMLNAAMGAVQLCGQADGLFGFILPGRAPAWGPSIDDLLNAPVPAALHRLAAPPAGARPAPDAIALVPDRPFLIGTMLGGPGALLAMGSMGLPLALAIALHVLAPRGSRERLADRVRHSGHGGLAVLLLVLLIASGFLTGLLAGPALCLPFAAALLVVGLPTAAGPGGQWSALGLTLLVLLFLGLGATVVAAWPALAGSQPPVPPLSLDAVRPAWFESLAILHDFPLLGAGLGSFRTIHPYFRTVDGSAGGAPGAVLRWGAEAGLVGLVLVALAAAWSAWRLPSCLKRVGTADRALAHGLIGAVVGLGLWSALQWTVELPAIAISASALGGTWDRWLAGGTDLFVERG
jgi:hypothetical protein